MSFYFDVIVLSYENTQFNYELIMISKCTVHTPSKNEKFLFENFDLTRFIRTTIIHNRY